MENWRKCSENFCGKCFEIKQSINQVQIEIRNYPQCKGPLFNVSVESVQAIAMPQRSTNYGRCTKMCQVQPDPFHTRTCRQQIVLNFLVRKMKKNYYRQPKSSFSAHKSFTLKLFLILSLRSCRYMALREERTKRRWLIMFLETWSISFVLYLGNKCFDGLKLFNRLRT